MRRTIAIAGTIAGLMLAAAACNATARPAAGLGGTTQSPSQTPAPASPSSPAATNPPAKPASTQVTIYYLVSGTERLFLAPERHRVHATQAIARAALEELVHGTPQDSDHSTPFPKSSKINSVVNRDGVATVDWSANVLEANAGAEAERLGIQSIVYTLTEFPSITSVRFTVEGKDHGTASNGRTIEDWWGHVGLDGQPFKRSLAIEVLEPITLWTPAEGSATDATLTLTGEASTFEANVGIVIRDANGKVLVRTSTTAAIAAPGRGRFAKTILLPAGASGTLVAQVIEDSAKDGSVLFMEDRNVRPA